MQISYQNNYKDLANFIVFSLLRTKQIIPLTIIPAAIALHMSYMLSTEYPIFAVMLTGLIMALLLFAILFALTFLITLLMMISKANKTFLCEHTITLNEKNLIEETRYNRSEHSWEGIHRVVETNKYIYAYISSNAAHVIPIRAFKDNQSRDAFVEFCKRMTTKA